MFSVPGLCLMTIDLVTIAQPIISCSMGAWDWEGSSSCLSSSCSSACAGSVRSEETGKECPGLRQEPHYASLQQLPVSSSDITDMKEDLSTDYACIARSTPT
uniref:Uncharacterized protein LST n=1 Tax=Mus musculus TaxID=10090 RepID=O09129_MOUSE|nr:unknown [Mus musculus]